jgi:putative toxin-antitoxin system antitoxin component (TIGR02293 family)
MTNSEYLVDVLGGAKVFAGTATPSSAELRQRVKLGLPYRSLESVRERLGLSVIEAANVLQVPIRTLARRREARRLAAAESDRLFRLARVAAQAVGTFGTEKKAAAWLRRPNRALDGEPPVRLLDTDVGTRQVEDILGRLAHGVVG